MVAIIISELTNSSIAEINTDEMCLIRGGNTRVAVSPQLLEVLPDLEAVNGLIVTQEILDSVKSLSLPEIFNLFSLVPIVSADEVRPSGRQINRRGLIF